MSIKQIIRKTAQAILQSKLYPNKKILLESIPDMGSQTLPVFNYMIQQGLNQKYKIIWLVSDKNEFEDIKIKNVKFMNYEPENRIQAIHKFYTLCTSRAMLYSHRYLNKVFDKQILVFLRHGSFIKSRLKHARINEKNESDLVVSMSEFFTEFEAKQLRISSDRFIYTGYPSDDYMYEETDYSKVLLPNHSYNKIIVWLPTFRKNRGDRIDSTFNFELGLPCLYLKDDCVRVNNELKKNNTLLVLKPHPAQDTSVIAELKLSNFYIIGDSDLKQAGIQLYQLLGSVDAMITDYSSVYYDFLITRKNIGLTIDDYEYYLRETGFAVDYFDVIKGEYIKECDDFLSFIKNVGEGMDPSFEEREKTRRMVYKYDDNKSSERVYNELIKALESRYS